MAQTRVRSFTAEYVWPLPDMEALRALITASHPGFLPPASVYVDSTIEGPIREEINYKALDSWLSELSMDVDGFNASLSGDAENRNLRLMWNSADNKFTVIGKSGHATDADAQLAAIRQAVEAGLGLKPRSKSTIELTFISTSAEFAFLTPFVTAVEEVTDASAQFRGTWKSADGVAGETKMKDEWLACFKAAQRWTAELQGRGHRAYVSFDAPYANVRFEISSWDPKVASELAARIKSLPGRKSATDRPPKQGEMRRYFLSSEATLVWYEKALGLILPFSQDVSSSPWGRIRRGGKNKSNKGYGDIAAWKSALQAGITDGDIEQSYLSWFGRERSITFDLDHLRDLLSIDVQSALVSEVEEMHLKLSTELNLTRAPDNAYRERQWGRTYDIKLPDPPAFANQLRQAVREAFGERRVVFRSGTLHMGGNDETVKPYSDLDALLSNMKPDIDLSEFHIVLEGRAGAFIGIHAEKKLTRMRLLAFMPLNDFTKFEATLKLGLKKMQLSESYDTDAATGRVEEKKTGRVWPVIVFVGGLLGGLIGTKGYDALREPAEIIIDRPMAKDAAAETQSHDTTVSWTYKTPRIFRPPAIDGNHEAIVNVTRLRDDHPIVQDERKAGRVALDGLEDGSYYIKIDGGESYKTLVLTVKSKPDAAPQPGPQRPLGKNGHGGGHSAL